MISRSCRDRQRRGGVRGGPAAVLGMAALLIVSQREEPAIREEIRVSRSDLMVRRAPSVAAPVRGEIAAGSPFRVLGRVEGEGCGEPGWGRLEGEGYACLAWSEQAAGAPTPAPRLVAFDPPEPEEQAGYLETGVYERSAAPEALLPFVYARSWRPGLFGAWASAEAWERGEDPTNPPGSLRFVDTVETARGTALLRGDGSAVPEQSVYLYAVSRFRGQDLEAEPLPVEEDGALLLPSGARLYPSPPPPEVSAEQLWLDVELGQQVAALMRGERPIYVTLISSGRPGIWSTPVGLYRIARKSAYEDMISVPESPEPYHVEAVPWILYFYPRYALHGVYWHANFGRVASHGCVNLSPIDARYLFERLDPALPPGWHAVYETPERPGALVRIRQGSAAVPDRRSPIL